MYVIKQKPRRHKDGYTSQKHWTKIKKLRNTGWRPQQWTWKSSQQTARHVLSILLLHQKHISVLFAGCMQGKEGKSCTKLPTPSRRGDYHERNNHLLFLKQVKPFPPPARALSYHIRRTFSDKCGIKGGIHSPRTGLWEGRSLKFNLSRACCTAPCWADPVWSQNCWEHHCEALSTSCTRGCGQGSDALGEERNLLQNSAAGECQEAETQTSRTSEGLRFEAWHCRGQE